MKFSWGEFFDSVVADKSWKNVGGTLKERVYELIADWIGGDDKTLRDAVKAALTDSKVTDKEMIGVLSIVALGWAEKNSELGGSFVQDLLKNLRDGELTSTEIAEVAANWVATHATTNETRRDLIKAAVQGKLTTDGVRAAILDWVEAKSGVPLRDRLDKILKSAKPVNLRSIVLLTVSYLVYEGLIRTASTTEEGQLAGLVGAIKKMPKSDLIGVFEKLVDEEYGAAAQKALKLFGMADVGELGQGLAKLLLGEKVDEVLADFIAGAFKRALKSSKVDDKMARALADALIGIVKGDVELIPAKTEAERFRDAYHIGSRDYAVWIDVRRVLYAAKLAMSGGPVVPTDAMARPHVFAAAAIDPEMRIRSLAGKDDLDLLLEYIFRFTRETFARRPNGEKYLTEAPVNKDMATAGGDDRKGVNALFMLRDICANLYP